jgi:hypothetical protein
MWVLPVQHWMLLRAPNHSSHVLWQAQGWGHDPEPDASVATCAHVVLTPLGYMDGIAVPASPWCGGKRALSWLALVNCR